MEFREDERLEFSAIIRAKHVGEQAHIKLLRDGQVRGACLLLGEPACHVQLRDSTTVGLPRAIFFSLDPSRHPLSYLDEHASARRSCA